MVILQEYKNWLDYFAKQKVNTQDFQEYKYHSGTNFELDINDTIIKNCNGFFLYWQIRFDFKTMQKWSLKLSMNNCFNEQNSKYTEADFLLPDINNVFNIDHLLITPYAVFIFEAKNHKTNNKYVSMQDKWNCFNGSNSNIIDNPVFQLVKYSRVVLSMMSYYKINLPVISKVVFKNKVNLDDVSEFERNSCIYAHELISTIHNERKNAFLADEALKLAKILYFYGCHPAAYDDNKLIWSSKND